MNFARCLLSYMAVMYGFPGYMKDGSLHYSMEMEENDGAHKVPHRPHSVISVNCQNLINPLLQQSLEYNTGACNYHKINGNPWITICMHTFICKNSTVQKKKRSNKIIFTAKLYNTITIIVMIIHHVIVNMQSGWISRMSIQRSSSVRCQRRMTLCTWLVFTAAPNIGF